MKIDSYDAAVQLERLVEAKVAGQDVDPADMEEPPQVIELLAALQQSVAAQSNQGNSRRKSSSRKSSSRKRSPRRRSA